MLKNIMKLFGGENEEGEEAKREEPKTEAGQTDSAKPDGFEDLENFVDYIVRALVDNPDEVSVSSEKQNDLDVINIKCNKDDIGKVVGRRGKTIMSIRSLVSGAASRLQRKVTVEVLD